MLAAEEGTTSVQNLEESIAQEVKEAPISTPELDEDELVKQRSAQEIMNVLEDHEKQFLVQEANRKDKIRQQLLDRTKMSQSYFKNSPKELLITQYLENFDRQYTQLYPGRKELILMKPNEFGTRKFVCNTIRPTQLPFKETYDFRSCASFVAEFIEYERLDPAHELPKTIQSPTYTIKMQSGTCFDISILLASLLIGVGYDAYVVSGYALRNITQLDQSKTTADHLKSLIPSTFQGIQEPQETQPTPVAANKYKVKKPKQLKSGFLAKQEEKIKVMQAAAEARAREAEQKAPQEEEEDELKGLRIHSWVLVLPGKREVSEAFFIEASTGAVYDCEAEQYLGVESVWSNQNYWVNMQICYDGLKGISFDLGDNSKWEFVLLDNTQPGSKKSEGEEGEAGSDEEEDAEKPSEILDMPPSWVDRLVISQEQFESKCPNGGKTTVYRNGKSEVFAEYHRKDGMVHRVTFFENDKEYPNLVLEKFANRKDKISHRVRMNDTIHEFFLPGRSHGLMEHIMVNGQTKVMEFYSSARPDGLVKRTEEPRKIIYYFVNRDDFLIYRSITYDVYDSEAGPTRGTMLKMTEKFARNTEIPAHEDFAKKTYFLKDEKIRVHFHLDQGRIIQSFREFRKPSPDQKGQLLELTQNFIVDPYLKPMKQQHLWSQFMDLFRAEQAFLQAAKTYERELADILQLRVNEEQVLSLSLSIYDTLRNDTKLPVDEESGEVTKGDEEGPKAVEIDYLSPFLIGFVLLIHVG
jgi:hypothetical protein